MKRTSKHSPAILFFAAMISVPIIGSSAQAQQAPAAGGAPPATQPSADVVTMVTDIQANIDTKQFPAAVKAAAKVLALHGPAAVGVDRFQVTMLKGYAQAGMKSMSTAVITFKSAIKETKDPREIALAKWTAELFRTAGSITYVPKSVGAGGQKRGPFDLLDADQRKDAFAALLDDDLALLDPKVKEATISQKLPEIFPVLQQVVDLDQLDQIANGDDDKTTTLASGLLDHARNLLTNALKSDWARVGDIDAHANITTTVPTQVVINNSLVTQTTTRKNGLSDSNRTELNNIISVCQKIHDAAESFLPLSKSDKDWSTIISDADRVASRASDVLNADYGGTTSSGSTVNDGGGGIGLGVDNQQLGGNPLYPSGGTAPPQPTTPPETPSPSRPTAHPDPSTPAKPPIKVTPGGKLIPGQ